MTENLPSYAQTVIIGGGSIGANTAYPQTKLGHRDVVVVEQGQLTLGTTLHAVGLIVAGLLKSKAECAIYTQGRALYAIVEKETGIPTGFRDVGYLQIATIEERLHEMRRAAAFMRHFGINNQETSVREAQEMSPIGDLSNVTGAFLIPEDGRANPVDVTMSLATGACKGGTRFFDKTLVVKILARNGTATGVRTADGRTLTAENVVICAGMWSRQLGAAHGVNLPLQAAQHDYLISEAIPFLPRNLPVLEDTSTHTYYREEVGGLMLGVFELGWRRESLSASRTPVYSVRSTLTGNGWATIWKRPTCDSHIGRIAPPI